jgi:hypothetical protein
MVNGALGVDGVHAMLHVKEGKHVQEHVTIQNLNVVENSVMAAILIVTIVEILVAQVSLFVLYGLLANHIKWNTGTFHFCKRHSAM